MKEEYHGARHYLDAHIVILRDAFEMQMSSYYDSISEYWDHIKKSKSSYKKRLMKEIETHTPWVEFIT